MPRPDAPRLALVWLPSELGLTDCIVAVSTAGTHTPGAASCAMVTRVRRLSRSPHSGRGVRCSPRGVHSARVGVDCTMNRVLCVQQHVQGHARCAECIPRAWCGMQRAPHKGHGRVSCGASGEPGTWAAPAVHCGAWSVQCVPHRAWHAEIHAALCLARRGIPNEAKSHNF